MPKYIPKPIKEPESYVDYLERIGKNDENLAHIKVVSCSWMKWESSE